MRKIILFSLSLLVINMLFSQDLITTWQTDNPGISNSSSITIPTSVGETYDYNVDWDNDGVFDEFGIVGDVTHDFGVPGTYIIRIEGTFPRIYFNNGGDREKLLSINQWGTQQWTSMEQAFYGCTNLQITATDAPNLSNVTNLSDMFREASTLNSNNLSSWNTGSITNMSRLFWGASAFNQNINSWDTSNVAFMDALFLNAISFNQQLNNWNTSSATSMSAMFNGASSFNRNLDNWDVSNVTNMIGMFANASAFNRNLNNWITGNVTSMTNMFSNAISFNQDLGSWDVSNVTDMTNMFLNVTLSIDNYDSLLIGWDAQALQNNISFHGGNSMYCNAETARNNMIVSDGWTITDAGINCPSQNFVTTWRTDNTDIDTSNETSITIPTFPGETYLYDVDWDNDGVFDDFDVTGDITHDYGVISTPIVRIRGAFPRIYFNNTGDRIKIQSVQQWGAQAWTSMENAFYGCTDLAVNVLATSQPNLAGVTSMRQMFRGAKSVNSSFNSWDTSSVTDMSFMFAETSVFNGAISNWDTSSVTTMSNMFFDASAFNQDIGNWDVSNVNSMISMFREASSFNQNIGDWDVGNVISMAFMFDGASVFNQDIGNWNTENVTNIQFIFFNATTFNQDISAWNTSSVTNMESTFRNASSFNQNISIWDTGNVTNMAFVFSHATAFNQNLGSWDVSNVTDMTNMFQNVTLSTTNYDNLLMGWNAQTLQNNVSFHGGNSVYCNGETARNNMIASNNWVITDDGLDCESLTYFITVWQTDAIETSITIPTHPDEFYFYDVDWDNDGIFDDIEVSGDITHDYGAAGIHTVIIRDVFPRIYFANTGDSRDNIVSLNQWGNLLWTSMESAFFGCSNLDINAADLPNLSNVTNMRQMFRGVNSINSDINLWDTSAITDMSLLFAGVTTFNKDISSWETNNVASMRGMFSNATAFNQNINAWDTSNVLNMEGMFFNATNFNSDIANWDTSEVTNMDSMFRQATVFNQDISTWNTSNVTNMASMFLDATLFNQNLGNWDVGNVTDMSNMLLNVTLSIDNYDDTLMGWNAQNLQNGVPFHGGNSVYCNGETARNNMIASDGWVIIDGGLDCTGLSTNNPNAISFSLYPNPVHDILFISGLTEKSDIKVMDFTGKIIIKTDSEAIKNGMDVTLLNNALYFIEVITANKKSVMKFIKK